MRDTDIRKEFSKAMTYPELFSTAIRLKSQGIPEEKINKFMSARKESLVKESKNIINISIVNINTKVDIDSSLVQRIELDFIRDGNRIIYDGNKVTFA